MRRDHPKDSWRGIDGNITPTAVRPICADQAMGAVFNLVARVAPWNLSVLITGETGVGKEVIAQAIHRLSRRAHKQLLSINCAAISGTLFESEVFGHEQGAFTGAVTAKQGLLEVCDGGTLFLDEVAELAAPVQAKLLRAVEAREVTPVGATSSRRIDVRLIAATNADLESEVTRGNFRADLFYRLNGFSILVPPLRSRRVEIPLLAAVFLEELSRKTGQAPRRLSPAAVSVLCRYDWPGNVRELRAVIERASLLCDRPEITEEHLGLAARSPVSLGSATPIDTAVPERDRIVRALESCAGNQTRAALLLGMARRTLVAKLDRYEICRPRKVSAAYAVTPGLLGA